MSEREMVSPKLATYGAAVVLSLLTLTVFAYSKDQGPESTVRLYHQAIIDGSMDGVRRLETGDGQFSRELAQMVGQSVAQSRSVSLGKFQKNGRRAYVDVIYSFAPNQSGALRFVVDKPGLKWRVNSDETVRLLSRMNRFE